MRQAIFQAAAETQNHCAGCVQDNNFVSRGRSILIKIVIFTLLTAS